MSVKSWIASAVIGTGMLGGGAIASAATTHSSPANNATTVSAPTPSTPTLCQDDRDGAWPPVVQGRPADLDAGDRGGVYLWHGTDGFHLVVTHHGDHEQVYSGTISTPGRIVAHAVRDEKADHVTVGPDGHTLSFRFTNYGHIDGVDFVTRCAPSLAVSVQGDGHELPPNRIYLGAGESSPTSNPFRIQRAL